MITTIPLFNTQIPNINIIQKVDKKPEPKLYTLASGDALETVAKSENTTVQRIFNKNPKIVNPDIIAVGDTIEIPLPDEQLQNRPMPVMLEVSNESLNVVATRNSSDSPRSFSSSGNTYSYGYCTWYAKNMRPDLPNDLGNADTWYIRYSGSKGTSPQVGAIGVAKGYMHVAYITGVNADGTVNLSEMNYQGWGVVSTRTASASEFLYIY